jgi:hypothetical protein
MANTGKDLDLAVIHQLQTLVVGDTDILGAW